MSEGNFFENQAHKNPLVFHLLTKLQSDAVESWTDSKKPYSAQTSISKNGEQFRVDTQSTSGRDTAIVKVGTATNAGNPLNVLQANYLTKIDIVDSDGGIITMSKAKISEKSFRPNQLVEPGAGRLSLQRLNTKGKVVQSFEPAVTKISFDSKTFRNVVDSEGYALHQTEAAGDRPNCRATMSGSTECNYILRDPKLAKQLGVEGDGLALSLTIDQRDKFDRQRSPKRIATLVDVNTVVRTLDGHKLGSIDQGVTLDGARRVTYISTKAVQSSRKGMPQGH